MITRIHVRTQRTVLSLWKHYFYARQYRCEKAREMRAAKRSANHLRGLEQTDSGHALLSKNWRRSFSKRPSTSFTLADRRIELSRRAASDPGKACVVHPLSDLRMDRECRLRREYNMLERILEEIDEEIGRLEQARTILGASRVTRASRTAMGDTTRQTRVPRRRALSASARRAIAEAQRRRWAKVRSQQKTRSASAMEKKEAAAS
jgi:hypothetical protein